MSAKKTILVIEDERELAEMIQVTLVKEGYEVVLTYDGETGLKKAKELKPDLITLDLKLPKLDGYKICEDLKADEKYQHIPVIMLSARDSDIEKKTGAAVGANAYLVKPYEPQILLKNIRKLLNG